MDSQSSTTKALLKFVFRCVQKVSVSNIVLQLPAKDFGYRKLSWSFNDIEEIALRARLEFQFPFFKNNDLNSCLLFLWFLF